MNEALLTEYGVVRGSVHKLGYGHKQAAAVSIVAGVSETGDCGGKPGAGRPATRLIAKCKGISCDQPPKIFRALTGWYTNLDIMGHLA